MSATASGTTRLSDDEAAELAQSVVDGRVANPGG
jgi:hypothetical protein